MNHSHEARLRRVVDGADDKMSSGFRHFCTSQSRFRSRHPLWPSPFSSLAHFHRIHQSHLPWNKFLLHGTDLVEVRKKFFHCFCENVVWEHVRGRYFFLLEGNSCFIRCKYINLRIAILDNLNVSWISNAVLVSKTRTLSSHPDVVGFWKCHWKHSC